MPKSNSRFLTVLVGALVSYALLETVIAYAAERQEKWRAWFDDFTAPYLRNPGRREWLRDTLVREEMTVRSAVTNDCADCNAD